MIENQLRTSLHDWAQAAPAGEPPIDDLIDRGGHRRRRRHATRLSVAGLVTVAVAAATGIGVNASSRPGPATPPASAAPVQPALTLAAAVKSTTSTSFRYESVLVGTGKSRCTGVIDPATESGYSRYGLTEHWVIKGVRYLKEGNHRYILGRGDAAQFLTCGGTAAGHGLLSADPLGLLDELKEVSSVQPGGNGSYAFRSSDFTGTVTLREGRVSSMTLHIESPRKRDVTMTLSDYGVPVSLKAPW